MDWKESGPLGEPGYINYAVEYAELNLYSEPKQCFRSGLASLHIYFGVDLWSNNCNLFLDKMDDLLAIEGFPVW